MNTQSTVSRIKHCLYHASVTAALLVAANACFAQSGQVLRYDGGSDDRAHAIATDSAGAIIVGGSSRNSTSPIGFAVVKYNSQGVFIWASRYQGTAPQVDGNVAALATDAAGNIYAAGYIARQLGVVTYEIDWLVVSFDANGAQRWAHVYNSPSDGYEQAGSVAIDSANSALYVTGITGNGNNFDWLTIKYSLNGTVLWQRTETGALNGDDRPVAANVRSFTDSGLNKKNTYAYRVRAFNSAGNSGYSNAASGKPQ